MNRPVFYIVKGQVTDSEAHDGAAQLGDTEWQFSDGPPGFRSTSADFIGDLDIAVYRFMQEHPDAILIPWYND